MSDPDDEDRMTYWRVEAVNASGSKKALRPFPGDVRWAPLRPAYPKGLGRDERKAWADDWYEGVYFAWKEAVIAAIAGDPQAAADEFARSVSTADLPEPVKKRVRPRPRVVKPTSAKQRQIAAERLMAEALKRAGMSERQVAGELGMTKSTARRRLTGGAVADGLVQVFLEARIARLMSQVLAAVQVASPVDLPRLQAQLEQVRRLQAVSVGAQVSDDGPGHLGVFGPRLAGDDQ